MKVVGNEDLKSVLEDFNYLKQGAMKSAGAIEVISHGISSSSDHYDIHYIGDPISILMEMVEEFDDELEFIEWLNIDSQSELGRLLYEEINRPYLAMKEKMRTKNE